MEENKEGTQQAAQEAYVRQLAELSARVLHMTCLLYTSEESKTAETYSEVVKGMQFDRGYITPYMVTDTERMEAVLDLSLIHILLYSGPVSPLSLPSALAV